MKKSISFDFVRCQILRYVLHCSNFFGARLGNPNINKLGGPNNSGKEGGFGFFFFFKKNKRGKEGRGGAFIRDLRASFMDIVNATEICALSLEKENQI